MVNNHCNKNGVVVVSFEVKQGINRSQTSSLLLAGIFWSFEINQNYYHFVGHCGAFCGLKWRIWRAKMYFNPPK